jgi:hypothetical protein
MPFRTVGAREYTKCMTEDLLPSIVYYSQLIPRSPNNKNRGVITRERQNDSKTI